MRWYLDDTWIAMVEIRDDNDENIGAKIINIGKIRGSNHHRRISEGTVRLKCIRSVAESCLYLCLRSGSKVFGNYREIQPIVIRFSPKNRVRLSEADRMRKERKKKT